MNDRSRKLKRPRDPNQLGKLIVDIATGQVRDEAPARPAPEEEGKDPAAVSLGRRGGLKGGPARRKKLTPEERSQIAARAARARWRKDR
jgi:hypothetical protein